MRIACSSIIPSSRSVGVLTSAVENFKRSFRRLPLVTLELAPPPERSFNPTEVSLTWVVLGPLEMRSVRLSREDPQKKQKSASLTQTRTDEIESSCAVSIARGYFKRNILNQVCGFMWGATVQNLWEVDAFTSPSHNLQKSHHGMLQKALNGHKGTHYITFSARRAPTAISTPPSIHTPGTAASSAPSGSAWPPGHLDLVLSFVLQIAVGPVGPIPQIWAPGPSIQWIPPLPPTPVQRFFWFSVSYWPPWIHSMSQVKPPVGRITLRAGQCQRVIWCTSILCDR